MEVGPIIAAMRRSKLGAVLIAVQIAVTLAILCNGIFIIHQRLVLIERPTGTDEANIFAIHNEWIGHPDDLASRTEEDLAGLRALPGVDDAYASNTYPLANSGSTGVADLQARQRDPTAFAARYYADEHTLHTLGLRLIAGRNFTPIEVETLGDNVAPQSSEVIVTRALAQELFRSGNALGRSIYTDLDTAHHTTIIGIVDRLQVPWTATQAGAWGSTFNDISYLLPIRPAMTSSEYVVRVLPGHLAAVMHAAQSELFALDGSRILSDVISLSDARQRAYQDDRGYVTVLAVVCSLILTITAFGIVGLTSYWVAQRRRQIGIRRALGGTRGAMVRYFLTENFLIASCGTIVGVTLTLGLNLWAVNMFEMARLPYDYVIIGAATVLLLGQGAAFWPALRASSIPPALAARSA